MFSARLARGIAVGSALTVTAALVSLGGSAGADTLAPKTTFTMVVNQADGTTNTPVDGESVPNVDSVKSTIRAYYNATGGIANKTSSRYLTEVRALEQHILSSLDAQAGPNEAVVFDADDTLLWNYDFEDAALNFNFDPAIQTTWVTGHLFPAVPGMPELVRDLLDRGYEIYGLTGRSGGQEADTIANLTERGYTDDGTPGGTPIFDAGNMYTKDTVSAGPPATIPSQPWVDCTLDGTPTSCSTVEFKALTRSHIETTDGVEIVMNVGDQWSDLQGGFADDYTKLPNPTYFLPSLNIAGHPASDVNMVPPTSYVMAPDGSSGYSSKGDEIPNIDPVRKLIRAYYAADSTGISNKVASPYITQLGSLTSTWTSAISNDCSQASQAHQAGVQAQAAATAVVEAAEKAVAKNVKAVAKAKKKLKNAQTPEQRRKARKQLAKAKKALSRSRAALASAQRELDSTSVPPAPAAVFDADDTTLWNYDLEDNVMRFVFDPAKQQIWITGHLFPAVPGMVALVKAASDAGCAIFGLTGRPTSQQADTIANLTEKGYVDGGGAPLFTAARFFTKGTIAVVGGNASIPTQPWVDCNGDGTRGACSTIEYKSGTRGHIEDLGFRVVGNFGDQYSDLIGGHADHTYKVPNPTYYLP
jgi:predicted secreted acid phosphatase